MRYLIILLVLCLFGCSATWHLQKAKEKGAEQIHDTVYMKVPVIVNVPGETKFVPVNPEIDKESFDATMMENDAIAVDIDALKKQILSGAAVDKEKLMAEILKKDRENQKLKSRIASGFIKDSTYNFQLDSVSSVDVTYSGGKPTVKYYRKPTKASGLDTVPVEIRNLIKAGFTWWQIIAAGIFAIVVGFLLGWLFRSKSD